MCASVAEYFCFVTVPLHTETLDMRLYSVFINSSREVRVDIHLWLVEAHSSKKKNQQKVESAQWKVSVNRGIRDRWKQYVWMLVLLQYCIE